MKDFHVMGFSPFWFWNDTLSADEIRWQVKEMADKGIRGFFIHPRQGLQQPYLSEVFFEMVDVAVEAAEEHGLYVHLYDEYPYPSGIAGGEVVLGSPQYSATRLVQQLYCLDGGHIRLMLPEGKMLSCMAYSQKDGSVDWEHGIDVKDHIGMVLTTESYRETGLTRYNQKRYFASEPRPVLEVILPEQPYKLFVSVQSEVTHFKYWDQYVDVLNPEAVASFIELTHERYRKRYVKKFGTRILSIFTDEIAPEWSSRIPEAFQAAYGYRLENALPALQDNSHPDHIQVSHDLYNLKYQMFCESYEAVVSGWCQRNGLAYSGEKPALRLSQLRYMDIPGCDPGHIKVGAKPDMLRAYIRQNAKAVASAGYFYGKHGTLCECYHSLGWSATLQDAKFIADGLLLMGISMLVPHGFFYSTHALKKHDAPSSFFFQMPFWPLFGKLAERVEWIQQLFEDTYIDAEILVVEPSSGIPTQQGRDDYVAILWLLMEQHLDFHIVDTDILEQSHIQGECIQVADISAKVVIVPPMQMIEEPLRKWLATYQAAGGTVLYTSQISSLQQLKEALLNIVQPSLSIQSGGEEVGMVLTVKRVSAHRTLWFVLNTGKEPVLAEFSSEGKLREIPFKDELPGDLRKEGDQYFREILPFESFVLEAVETAEIAKKLPRIKVPVSGAARLCLANANLLRMSHWRMSLLEDQERYGPPATVPAIPLINQLIEGQFRFTPAYQEYFGHVAEMTLPKLQVRYEFCFDCQYAGPVQLVMEPGSIIGDWRISINQSNLLHQADFHHTDVHVRGSLGVDITMLLQQGNNFIRLEVVTDRLDGGLLNPLYLAGDFGVVLDPVRLVPQKTMGSFERYEENLLPYYAGMIEYTTEFTLDYIPESDEVIVEFNYDEPFHESTEVSINESAYMPVLWQPRHLKFPVDRLHVGNNTLRTRVYTTLIRSFEGQWFDYHRHEYRDVGE
jgi:hypothetical protein